MSSPSGNAATSASNGIVHGVDPHQSQPTHAGYGGGHAAPPGHSLADSIASSAGHGIADVRQSLGSPIAGLLDPGGGMVKPEAPPKPMKGIAGGMWLVRVTNGALEVVQVRSKRGTHASRRARDQGALADE